MQNITTNLLVPKGDIPKEIEIRSSEGYVNTVRAISLGNSPRACSVFLT